MRKCHKDGALSQRGEDPSQLEYTTLDLSSQTDCPLATVLLARELALPQSLAFKACFPCIRKRIVFARSTVEASEQSQCNADKYQPP